MAPTMMQNKMKIMDLIKAIGGGENLKYCNIQQDEDFVKFSSFLMKRHGSNAQLQCNRDSKSMA